MIASVLCVGTELTRGEIENTNATWLVTRLTELGFDVREVAVVPDDVSILKETVLRLGRDAEVLVCTGGLGPTTDDLTNRSVGEALGVPLERDAASLAAIRERMQRFGRQMAPSNEKQADFPAGARVLPNARGTAPGFQVQIGRAKAFFLPGVPREMKPMFEEAVVPAVGEHRSGYLHQVRLRCFGRTESAINDALAGIESEHVTLGYRAHFPEIEVKVLARADDAAVALARAQAASEAARGRLGRVVFGEGDTTLGESVHRLLLARGLSLGAAESCTGGLLAHLLTEHSGASQTFVGAVVAYANPVKQALLGVSAEALEAEGAVSETVAQQMARGALEALKVDVAVAVTGIAGPTGGTAEKPVGLVHYAVATRSQLVARHFVYPGSRAQVQRYAAFCALDLVRDVLSGAD